MHYCNIALGMGLDIRDVQLVVHIGCPKYILSYWKEAGRCARDGRQGFSLILYEGFTLDNGQRHGSSSEKRL